MPLVPRRRRRGRPRLGERDAASLRAGLGALAGRADAAVVTLVDLPDVRADVVRRVSTAAPARATLARATYEGRPGHPVLLGRDHWAGVTGDRDRRQRRPGLPRRPRRRSGSSAVTSRPGGTSDTANRPSQLPPP